MQGSQQPPELLAYKALQAVQRGNAEELAKLIEAGANAHVINAVVKTGTSPTKHHDHEAKGGLLYDAVDKQNVELVKVLLGNGAEVNGSKHDENPPPLRAAVFRKNIELVTLLLKRGANVNRKYTVTTGANKTTMTVLFESTSDAIFGLLLRRGGDVNIKDSNGDTLLHVHAAKWNASFVSGLVEHGADVNARDEENRTPLLRALAQWDNQPGCNEEEEFIDVCHILMSHKAILPQTDPVVSKTEHSERLHSRLQLVKEWAAQRDIGMVALTHVPVEIFRRGATEIATYFASNTLVPVVVEQSELRTEVIPEASRRQTKTGIAAWESGEEVLQRQVEILPALDRSPSLTLPGASSDDISPFPIRQELDPVVPARPSRANSSAWLSPEEMNAIAAVENQANATVSAMPVAADPVEPIQTGHEATGKSSVLVTTDLPSRLAPVASEASLGPVISAVKPALPPVSPRSALPALQLYRLKILCATGLRRVLKLRRQNPYCVCRLVRGDGEKLAQFKTSVHPGGGEVPTWRGQVFELALTPENTRTCTLVFILKHSGVMNSLDERIAVGTMPFPLLPVGHSLSHKLLLMNNDKPAGRLEIFLEGY